MYKNRHIISELSDFFTKSSNNRAINSIMNTVNHIRITEKQLGVSKHPNCKFTSLQVFHLLLLFPFFMVKNALNYSCSSLGDFFCREKDMFYRFMGRRAD